jgi:tetratricopeptide (TPR) repeat protein
LFLVLGRSSAQRGTIAVFSSRSPVSCRLPYHGLPAAAVVLAGTCLVLAGGCGGFTAQGRNAEGVRLFQQGQYQAALRQFQEANYADPDNADSYYNLAAAYHRIGSFEKRQSDLDQAENYYNQCLDHAPDHHEAYRGLAVLLAEQGRTDDAFRLVQGWVDRAPHVADAKIELARLYEEFGDPTTAKDQLIEALKVEPENARALAALGKIREKTGEHYQALADYQRSLWHDSFQPQVAARVSALQTAVRSATPTPTPDDRDDRTRMVDKDARPLR